MGDNLKTILKSADRVIVEYFSKDGNPLTFNTEIVEVLNENKVEIFNPLYKGNVFPINTGSRILVKYNKAENGVYTFTGLVVKRDIRNNMPSLHVLRVSDIDKTQRREYFRLSVLIEMTVKKPVGMTVDTMILNGVQIEEEVVDYKDLKGIIKDISGGGCRVQVNEIIKFGTEVILLFNMNNIKYKLEGVCVRCLPSKSVPNAYEVGISFIEIDESVRSRIVSYIFEKQRNLMKKGLM